MSDGNRSDIDVDTLMERIEMAAELAAEAEWDDVRQIAWRWRRERNERIRSLTTRLRNMDYERARAVSNLEDLRHTVDSRRNQRDELATRISELLETSPVGADPRTAGEHHLRVAAQVSSIGAESQRFEHHGPIKRLLTRFVSRLAGPMTAHQRAFNGAVLSLLSSTIHSLEDLQIEKVNLQAEIAIARCESLQIAMDQLDLEERVHELEAVALRGTESSTGNDNRG
jgi:hypothetical protein